MLMPAHKQTPWSRSMQCVYCIALIHISTASIELVYCQSRVSDYFNVLHGSQIIPGIIFIFGLSSQDFLFWYTHLFWLPGDEYRLCVPNKYRSINHNYLADIIMDYSGPLVIMYKMMNYTSSQSDNSN